MIYHDVNFMIFNFLSLWYLIQGYHCQEKKVQEANKTPISSSSSSITNNILRATQ